MFPPASIKLTSQGRPVTVHLFSTGKIAGRLSSHWQPIWILAIVHPEGIFLVDTGERAHKFHLLYKFDLERDDEADRQLARVNIKTSQIKTIILTHRHFDHIDGLYHFPNTPIRTDPGYVTEAKDLVIIHTPGHTRDHCSVLLKTDTTHILFGGDIAPNHPFVKAYAQTHPLTLLLTHDPESSRRLAALEPLPSLKTGIPTR